jgi:hypothetical protein
MQAESRPDLRLPELSLNRVGSSPEPISGLIFGKSSARPSAAVRKASCKASVARRVGSSKVVSASCIGPGRAPPGTGRLPARSALASSVRNCRPVGTV